MRMLMRTVFIALVLWVVAGAAYAQTSCGTLPPLVQGGSKEEQLNQLLQRAIACVREGKPALSIEIFSEMIGIDPDNDTAYLNRGNAYLQTGQITLSIADFSLVIGRKPDATQAWQGNCIPRLSTIRPRDCRP
jgi:tetratricopeptide (TPR) repeat protein